MATKTITIMEDAYEMIKKAKKEGESFSDLFRREFSRKRQMKSIMDFAGAWKEFPVDDIKAEIEEGRKFTRKRKMQVV